MRNEVPSTPLTPGVPFVLSSTAASVFTTGSVTHPQGMFVNENVLSSDERLSITTDSHKLLVLYAFALGWEMECLFS